MSALALALVVGSAASSALARPHYPEPFQADAALDTLQKRVRAPGAPIEIGCRQPGPHASPCARRALDGIRNALAATEGSTVRVLHLGDSHVAADYITSRIRRDLQAKHGTAGRGFMHPDQLWGYGGRRVSRSKEGWIRDRIVDSGRAGRPYGFSGVSLTAKNKGVSVRYRVLPKDREVRIFYGARKRARITVWLDGQRLGRFDLSKPEAFVRIALPDRTPRKFRRGPEGNTLRVRADRVGVALYGVSFSTEGPGLEYTTIGPVGADAKVYLQLDRNSFTRHLKAYRPDLVILMVGGNDALKIRKRWTTLAKVTRDHERLLRLIRQTLPDADCMVWSPMVAGRKKGRRIVTKAYLDEVRTMQRRVARAEGCGFWDTLAAMGGPDNIRRWAPAMADDLVHPRKRAADLLGRMFVDAWVEAVGPD